MRLRDGDLMGTTDAATVLGLSLEMVTKLRRQGRLPAVRTVGGQWIFLARDVRRLLEQRRKARRWSDGGGLGAVRVPPP